MRDLAREELIAELLALRPIFEKKGVKSMALFGSRSRGDNRADSDVDLLIEVVPGQKFSLLDMAGVYAIVEDNLGLESSIVIDRDLDPRFEAEIRPELVSVY